MLFKCTLESGEQKRLDIKHFLKNLITIKIYKNLKKYKQTIEGLQ